MSQVAGFVGSAFIVSSLLRLRGFALRVLKGVGVTWLFVALFSMQAAQFGPSTPVMHPVQRLIAEGGLVVDAASITVVSELTQIVTPDLSTLKSLIAGVTQSLGSLDDAPKHWELIAESVEGYRSVRYEGRGDLGTHWVVTAYQLAPSEKVHVALRSELRGLPDELRLASHRLRQHLHSGVGQSVKHVDTRIVVSGRTGADKGMRPADFAQELLDTLGHGQAMLVREEANGVWVAGYSPYLVKSEGTHTNIDFHLVPEGEYTRLTLGTPYLGEVESSLSSGRPFTYTSLPYGQTMAKEVR